MRAGLYVTPINWHLSAAEAAYIVEDCGASVLVRLRRRWPRSWRGSTGSTRSTAGSPSAGRCRASTTTTPPPPPSPPTPPDRGVRGQLDVLLVGHDRAAEGHQARDRSASRSAVVGRRLRAAGQRPLRRRPRHHLPEPGAALPRRPGRVDDGGPAPRRHRRGDGALRPRRGRSRLVEAHRVTHAQFVPDPPRAHAQAHRRRGAAPLRPVEPRRSSCTPPRRARPT